MTPRTEIDRDKLKAYVKRVGSSITAGYNCAISSLGDRLGLYRALRELRIASSEDLAHHTGLNERWIREWLRHQACVEQVEYDAADGSFLVVARSDCGAARRHDADLSRRRFRRRRGDDAVAAGARREFPHRRRPQRTTITARVARAASSGCRRTARSSSWCRTCCRCSTEWSHGSNPASVSPTSVAAARSRRSRWRKAFPRSTFVGYDNSAHALERARANAKSSEASRTSSSSIPTSARCRIGRRSI